MTLQVFKLIFVNTREREILAYYDAPLGSCWKDHKRMELTFPGGFGTAAEPVFLYVRQS